MSLRPNAGRPQGWARALVLAIPSLRGAWLPLEPALGCLLYIGRGGTLNTPSKDANRSQYLTWGLGPSWLPWQRQGSPSKVERGPWEIAYLSESSVTLAQERGIPALSPRSLQAGSLSGRQVWLSCCVSLAAQVFPQCTANGSRSCPRALKVSRGKPR